MPWTFRICFGLFIAWAIFMVSPFVALYDLANAVEKRDPVRIEERVNFRAVRISVSRQIIGDYLHTPEGRARLGGLDSRAAATAGANVINPLVEQLVTPQALIDLLDDGWPQQVTERAGANPPPLSIDLGSAKGAWRLFLASESAGFRSVTVPFPAEAAKDDQFRLTMRLSGTTWRLTGVEFPKDLREELIRRVPKITG